MAISLIIDKNNDTIRLEITEGISTQALKDAGGVSDVQDANGNSLVVEGVAVIDFLHTTPEQFGALADGVNDDFQAIQDAVYSDYDKIVIGKGKDDVYKISQPISIPSNKHIEINGTVKLQDGFVLPLLSNLAIGGQTVFVQDAELYFEAGQQIGISDDNQAVQGGNAGHTRREGVASRIVSVSGNEITIQAGLTRAFTVAANAKIGHHQSCFIAENVSGFVISGTGAVDENKTTQIDINPVGFTDGWVSEDIRYGCALSITGSSNFEIRSGLKFVNSVLHNLAFKNNNNFKVGDFISDGAHDKAVLLWLCNKFHFGNLRLLNSDYEDGFIIYSSCTYGYINSVYVENCGRAGFHVGDSNNITVGDIQAVNCGQPLIIQDSDSIRVNTIQTTGGGAIRYGSSNRNLIQVSNSTNSYIDAYVKDSLAAVSGVAFLGSCNNIEVVPKVKNLTNTSPSRGIGVLLGVQGGQTPKNITITNPYINGNRTGIKIDSGCENIMRVGGDISGNLLANTTNSIGLQYKVFNVDYTVPTAVNPTDAINKAQVEGIVAAVKEHQINGTRLTANITGTFNFDWTTGVNGYSQFVLTPTGATTLGNVNLPTGTNTLTKSGIFKASANAVTFPTGFKAAKGNDPLSATLDTHCTLEVYPDYVLYTLENILA